MSIRVVQLVGRSVRAAAGFSAMNVARVSSLRGGALFLVNREQSVWSRQICSSPVLQEQSSPEIDTSSGEAASAAKGLLHVPPIRFKPQNEKPKPVPLLEAIQSACEGAKNFESIQLRLKVNTLDKAKKKGKPRDKFRGIVILPHPFRPPQSVVVLTNSDESAAKAKAAGASAVGDTSIVGEITSGDVECDILLATPDIVNLLKPFGRQLGRRMPSVKRGTVGDDIVSLVKERTAGVTFTSTVEGFVDLGLGKCKFTPEQLVENMDAIVKAIEKHRLQPTGRFILEIALKRTHGPNIIVDPRQLGF